MAATPDRTIITALLVALGTIAALYAAYLGAALLRTRRLVRDAATPTGAGTATGFVTNFFDTLGVGSFATTTSIWRQWRMVPDEQIPGTLNVGHTFPTIVQAFIYTKLVPVDGVTLASLIGAAVVGAWLGAGVVSRWPRRRIQIGMGIALLVFAVLMAIKVLGTGPVGGSAMALTGARLAVGVVGNFALGALMTLGIGLYGPCMIMIYMLGMNPIAAFPIMMGSCAFLMPVASARFIRAGSYAPRAAVGLLLGGIPAVLIAAFIVKSMSLRVVGWLVVAVVIYTAVNMLRAAMRERAAGIPAGAVPDAAA